MPHTGPYGGIEGGPDVREPGRLVEETTDPHLLVNMGGAIVAPLMAEDRDGEIDDIRDREVFRLRLDGRTREVHVSSDLTPEDYQRITPEDDWKLFAASHEPLRGKKVVAIGATFEGGGVAMIRPPQLHLMRQMGVETHWGVLDSPPELGEFTVTKKMHNLQQDMAEPGTEFTEEDEAKHQALGIRNFGHMNEQDWFRDADVYVIDDPQPAAMIPLIKQHYPNAIIIFRNHIQTDRDLMATEGSQQERIYKYLHEKCGVDGVDAYIAHPVEQFVPYDTQGVVYMPPTSDQFEDLNRPLTPEEIEAGLDHIDNDIRVQNEQRRRENGGSSVDDQEPLDRDRPRITLFARFDPAKGKHIGMELQRRTVECVLAAGGREDQIPEYLDIGNGSVDDTDRARMIDAMLKLRNEKYGDIRQYIKVVGMSHNYPAVNALLRTSMFAENPSTAEGFEHRATEAIIKGVPAIVSNRGGLPLQVRDGVSGFVLNFDSLKDRHDLDPISDELDRVAQAIADCILDPAKYRALQESTLAQAAAYNLRDIGTVANATRWALAMRGRGDRTWRLDDLIEREFTDDKLAA